MKRILGYVSPLPLITFVCWNGTNSCFVWSQVSAARLGFFQTTRTSGFSKPDMTSWFICFQGPHTRLVLTAQTSLHSPTAQFNCGALEARQHVLRGRCTWFPPDPENQPRDFNDNKTRSSISWLQLLRASCDTFSRLSTKSIDCAILKVPSELSSEINMQVGVRMQAHVRELAKGKDRKQSVHKKGEIKNFGKISRGKQQA